MFEFFFFLNHVSDDDDDDDDDESKNYQNYQRLSSRTASEDFMSINVGLANCLQEGYTAKRGTTRRPTWPRANGLPGGCESLPVAKVYHAGFEIKVNPSLWTSGPLSTEK